MTDATASYTARVFPPTWRVLGHRLHTLTLGHAHLLCAATEWRPFEPYAMTDQLFASALYICSRPWRKVRLDSWRAEWFAVGIAIRGKLARVDLTEKGAVLADYLRWHTSGPSLLPAREAKPHGPYARAARELGSPVLARLRMFAGPYGGMDALLAETYWLWAVAQEEAGNVRIATPGDRSFEEYCAAEDALVAAAAKGGA